MRADSGRSVKALSRKKIRDKNCCPIDETTQLRRNFPTKNKDRNTNRILQIRRIEPECLRNFYSFWKCNVSKKKYPTNFLWYTTRKTESWFWKSERFSSVLTSPRINKLIFHKFFVSNFVCSGILERRCTYSFSISMSSYSNKIQTGNSGSVKNIFSSGRIYLPFFLLMNVVALVARARNEG